MSVLVSTYITYHPSKQHYTIRKKKCKLNAASQYSTKTTNSSINTSKKAEQSELDAYYDQYGTKTAKKYRTVDVKINY